MSVKFSNNLDKAIIHDIHTFYKIKGEVVFAKYGVYIIDCGLLISSEKMPEAVKVGDSIECHAQLFVNFRMLGNIESGKDDAILYVYVQYQ